MPSLQCITPIYVLETAKASPPPSPTASLGKEVWSDLSTRLMWALEDNGTNINWYDAAEYCQKSSLGGYSDWRMPTIDELANIYDKSQRDGAYYIKGGIHLTMCCVWSSSKSSDGAWNFGFGNGERYSNGLYYPRDVRALCVRGPK
jgi:formylglycine-generating enzyme required for sulfatase activity